MNKLIKLVKLELKKIFGNSSNWLMALLFMLVNTLVIPFTSSPDGVVLRRFYLPIIMSSILLGIVLLTNQHFDEDIADGTLDQLQAYGIGLEVILIGKSISLTIILSFILFFLFLISALFYAIDIEKALYLWLLMLCFNPLLNCLSVFGAMLTASLKKNNIVSIILIFPLFISVLIIACMAAELIIYDGELANIFSYISMNIGISAIMVPLLCLLAKYLR